MLVLKVMNFFFFLGGEGGREDVDKMSFLNSQQHVDIVKNILKNQVIFVGMSNSRW